MPREAGREAAKATSHALARVTHDRQSGWPPADSLERRQGPGRFPGVAKGIRPVAVRAIRGAVQVDANERAAVLDGTAELVTEVMTRNGLAPDDVISVVFTATPDLTAEFPALAARKIGFQDVPLLCASEIDVPGALPRIVRLLMHVETGKPRAALQHVYLRGAAALRLDIAQ
jgi:chorismate mutase